MDTNSENSEQSEEVTNRLDNCTFDNCDNTHLNAQVLKNPILKNHTKNKERKFICNYEGCGQTFLKPSNLEWHMNVHANKRPYKCTFAGCDKSYNNPSHLKRHALNHDSLIIVKKYRCEICRENFSHSGNLQRHFQRFHTDNTKYCVQCNKCFRKNNMYEDHIRNFHKSHVDLKRFECELCGAVVSSYKAFKRHKKIHLKKRFACYVKSCLEEFYTRNLLAEHMKTCHVFRYTCDHCNKIFWVKSKLRSHIQTHIDNRKLFHCTYKECDRMYYFKKNLTQHIQSFHLGKKFICGICNLKLSTKQKLDHHRQKVHQCN